MTREQIEADIAQFERALATADNERHTDPGLIAGIAAIRRALARLRADLARLDGPADGFRRSWIVLVPASRHDSFGLVRYDAYEHSIDPRSVMIEGTILVTADIPLPRVVEVDGTVVE